MGVEDNFIQKITEIVAENISDERFGVSELAEATGMSRSNLLRKVKKLTKLSVSQFVRKVRLEHSMELLKQTSYTVSEISFKVGFSSTSYFIKCFRELYGYPPGEVGKREEPSEEEINDRLKELNLIALAGFVGIILISAIIYFHLNGPPVGKPEKADKSIAVLPFKNDSNDSTNVYIINGLMESILNNLQKIEDLRVVSRTSVEKYRTSPKTIPEIADELGVKYFVEGSGQKIDDQILLTIQLIEASDRHLWAEQYDRNTKDIFGLQKEVATKIAGQIEVIITPEEEAQIAKIPTENLVAYDHFLKGKDKLFLGSIEALEEAIIHFKSAIEEDKEFAHAYAEVAIAYYYLDLFKEEKKYTDLVNSYADQALLFDPKLPQSLIAKALYYLITTEYDQAVPYLEKALEYNPNSSLAINMLSNFYANYQPNTSKYLEYALKGIQLDIAGQDSTTASYIYLHVSNAFIQSGFVEEALVNLDMSLAFNPSNLFSEYVKAFVLYAKDGDLQQTRELLIKAFNKDTTRLDILQEIGKICYYQRDFESAYLYYKSFVEIRTTLNLDLFTHQNLIIGNVYDRVGKKEEATELIAAYKEWLDQDQSLYQSLGMAMYNAYIGDETKALEYMEEFAKQDDYHYWTILFVGKDPLIDEVKDDPTLKKLIHEIEVKFWNKHLKIKSSLEERGLI